MQILDERSRNLCGERCHFLFDWEQERFGRSEGSTGLKDKGVLQAEKPVLHVDFSKGRRSHQRYLYRTGQEA